MTTTTTDHPVFRVVCPDGHPAFLFSADGAFHSAHSVARELNRNDEFGHGDCHGPHRIERCLGWEPVTVSSCDACGRDVPSDTLASFAASSSCDEGSACEQCRGEA